MAKEEKRVEVTPEARAEAQRVAATTAQAKQAREKELAVRAPFQKPKSVVNTAPLTVG